MGFELTILRSNCVPHPLSQPGTLLIFLFDAHKPIGIRTVISTRNYFLNTYNVQGVIPIRAAHELSSFLAFRESTVRLHFTHLFIHLRRKMKCHSGNICSISGLV